MTRPIPLAILLALAALAAATSLTACGHRGALERPAPWWGEDRRTAEERAHENQQGDEERGDEEKAEAPQR